LIFCKLVFKKRVNTDLSSEQFRQLSVLSNTGIAPDRAIAALESGSKSQSFLPVKNKKPC